MTPETLKKLFLWLTASVQGASMGVGTSEDAAGIDLGKKPKEIEEVTPGSYAAHDGMPRQVFLKVYCSKVRRPYLMRYRLDEEMQGYLPVASHPLESTIDKGPGFVVPPINSSQLLGCPPALTATTRARGCAAAMLLCVPDDPTPSSSARAA